MGCHHRVCIIRAYVADDGGDTMNKCCKTCGFWNYAQAADKLGRVRKDNVARCLWKSTEIWPLSVTGASGWSNTRPEPRYMSPIDGIGCPCWKAR